MFFGEAKNNNLSLIVAILLVCLCFISVACQSKEQKLEVSLNNCQNVLNNGDLSNSVICYSNIETSFKEFGNIIDKQRDGAFFEKCSEYSKNEELKNSILCYETLSNLSQDNALAYFKLASAYLNFIKYEKRIEPYSENLGASKTRVLIEKAEEAVKKGLKISESNSAAYSLYGDILLENEEWHRAINQYNKAIELAPNDASNRVFLAIAKEKVGEYDFAIESYKKAIDLDADLELAWYNLGILYEKKGNFKDAIKCFEKVNELHPNFDDTNERLENLKEKIKPQHKTNQPVYRMIERPKQNEKPL